MREYGSEFHWNSRAEFEKETGSFPLENSTFYRSGRDALRQIAAFKAGKTVLLPALCCESMVLPFKQYGCPVKFYRLNEYLCADMDHVLSLVEPGCMLLYMPFFDRKPFTDEELQTLDLKGVFLIEDRTQDIIKARMGGFQPQATVASLRKWLALPEGGLLSCWLPFPDPVSNSRFASLRRNAMEQKGEYLEKGEPQLKEQFLQSFRDAEALLDKSPVPMGVCPENLPWLNNIDVWKILRHRRANCAALDQALDADIVSGRIKTLYKGGLSACLYYPILVENRDEIQKKLADKNIYCPVIWPLPEEAKGVCPNCDNISQHILALPCDQRYSTEDMEHIASCLKEIL